ncbi:MAG: response regulator [Anaerolineales bacterium]|nr:response regulator [Anaerolineales bacterium]
MSLETIGCRLTICPNRTEAEEIIANDPPKLILLSDQIGEPDVFQTIRDLSRSYPLIPIVFVPARQPPELAAAIDAGISGYIPPSARSSEIQRACGLRLSAAGSSPRTPARRSGLYNNESPTLKPSGVSGARSLRRSTWRVCSPLL